MSTQISVADYAKARGITPQAVHQNIKKDYALPGVTNVSKIGKNTYVLTVDATIVKPEPPSEEEWE